MKQKKLVGLIGSICLIVAMVACAAPAPAPPTPAPTPTPSPIPEPAWKPPQVVGVVLTATGTVGYPTGVALFSTIGEITGVKFPTTPAAKTMGRFILLRDEIVIITQTPALDVYLALEGTVDFADWGPQSVRTIWDCGPIDQGIATRGNSGIETMADIVGKRISTYPTYPMVQFYMEAAMAYANLSWDDVVPTPVSSFAAGQNALIEGAVDVAVVSGQSAAAFELDSSIHGIHWIEMPASETEAWARYHQVNPCFYPNRSSTAASASKDKPVEIWGYSYQISCYDWVDEDLVYWLVKQMHENYDIYKTKHAYLMKYTLEHALNSDLWFAPRHSGSVKYFKDVGLWTPEMESKQQELLAKYPQTMTRE